ncbi:hypothetical protein FKM82_026415 [Ascaphus truei]
MRSDRACAEGTLELGRSRASTGAQERLRWPLETRACAGQVRTRPQCQDRLHGTTTPMEPSEAGTRCLIGANRAAGLRWRQKDTFRALSPH